MHYILIEKEPIPCDDEDLWRAWWKKSNQKVALTQENGFKIETNFLGVWINLDDQLNESPLFFRTMVYGKNWKVLKMAFCSTWEEAESEHSKMVEKYIKKSHQTVTNKDIFLIPNLIGWESPYLKFVKFIKPC